MSTVYILKPSRQNERDKVDDFYAIRDNTMPPLPWTNFAPPHTPPKELFKVRTVLVSINTIFLSVPTVVVAGC